MITKSFQDEVLNKKNSVERRLTYLSAHTIRLDSFGYAHLITIRSGATQAAAGASANELWKTSGHASLPDNVLMIGV